MSLQVWLPLNGNLNNQGLGNFTASCSNPSFVAGKIGKCLISPNTVTIRSSELNYNKFSVVFWFKCKTGFSGDWKPITTLSVTNPGLGTSGNIRFEQASGSSYFRTLSTHNNTSFDIDTGSTVYSTTTNVWQHVVYTYNGETGDIVAYLNGSLHDKRVGRIGGRLNGYIDIATSYEGWICDYRIYDHCLSPFEVKEISKALVCHYKLSSQFETGQTNKYSGRYAEGYIDGVSCTKLSDERGYNYKFSYTGTGDNYWQFMVCPNFSFTAGKTYYYSCKVRCRSANFTFGMRAARVDNDYYGAPAIDILQNKDGEWHEYVVYINIPTSFTSGGTTYTSNPRLEIVSNNLSASGTVYSADFDIKDIQVIESDCYVPFIDNTMVTSVTDCSGYGNNGTRSGTITWSDNSPRYKGSYNFATTTSYINCGQGGKVSDAITVNFWAHMSTWTNNIRMISCTEGGGWNFEPDGGNGYISFALYVSGVGYRNAIVSKTWASLASGWHMFTGTYDGLTVKLYIDGELSASISSTQSSKTAIGYHSTNSIFLHAEATASSCSTGFDPCKISDCRIYATALSAEDVKILYHTVASVDKSGVMAAYEFVED